MHTAVSAEAVGAIVLALQLELAAVLPVMAVKRVQQALVLLCASSLQQQLLQQRREQQQQQLTQ
jgi:hypothetical protein